ncbi:MAG: hypothetical protein H6581_18100 [Bacteroidia bacterium]|nr:hypothetical protein [Bacteroidia bacterium]
MKHFRLQLLTFLLLFAGFTRAQDTYHVIYVKGLIVNKANNNPLKQGDQIDSNTEIVFKSTDALATILSKSKGRFNLKSGQASGSGQSEFMAYVRNCISPPNPHLSSSLGKSANLEQFQRKGQEKKLVVLRQIKIQVDSENYPPNASEFTLTSAPLEADKLDVNQLRYLEREKDHILIGHEEIWQAQKENNPVTLAGIITQNGQISAENFPSITFVAPDLGELQKSISTLVAVLDETGADEEEKLEEIQGFLKDQFGEFSPKDLDWWLEQEFPDGL